MFGGIGSGIGVVEVVEVVHHELHDFGIVVELVVGVFDIVLDVLQLDDAGVAFLLQVNTGVCSTFGPHEESKE